MKKLLIGLGGIVQGIVGTAWNLLGLLFILHPDSAPGTKEWEEDRIFIPIGYVMLVIWLIAMFFSYYKFRKSKTSLIIFSVAWLVSTITCIILMFFVYIF